MTKIRHTPRHPPLSPAELAALCFEVSQCLKSRWSASCPLCTPCKRYLVCDTDDARLRIMVGVGPHSNRRLLPACTYPRCLYDNRTCGATLCYRSARRFSQTHFDTLAWIWQSLTRILLHGSVAGKPPRRDKRQVE